VILDPRQGLAENATEPSPNIATGKAAGSVATPFYLLAVWVARPFNVTSPLDNQS
jgi:hypothetical protein